MAKNFNNLKKGGVVKLKLKAVDFSEKEIILDADIPEFKSMGFKPCEVETDLEKLLIDKSKEAIKRLEQESISHQRMDSDPR